MGYMLQKEERRMGGDNVSQDQTSIICIDLKSFYASVECVERGLDPFKAQERIRFQPDRRLQNPTSGRKRRPIPS